MDALDSMEAVSEQWLEWRTASGRERRPLRAGLTLIGGSDADIPLPEAGADQLHVWDHPPKVVLLGEGEPPEVNGVAAEETALQPGDVIRWHGRTFLFGASSAPEPGQSDREREAGEEDSASPASPPPPLRLSRQAELTEIPAEPSRQRPSKGAAPDGLTKAERTAWRWLKAGMFVELGLADPPVARTWQKSVARGEWDPEAAARDILGRVHFPESDPRLLQRSGRLMRDLLMAPVQRGARGAGRRARGAARSGAAFLIAQVAAIVVYSALLFAFLTLARLQWGWSLDGAVDAVLDLFRSR